jgi:hypothetical protein
MHKWIYIMFMLLMAACEKDQVQREEIPTCEPVCTGTYSVFHDDPFDITGAEIIDDCLKIEVRYGGGCKIHDFTLYYTPLPDFSLFSGVLQLSHNANGDTCKALCHEDIYFDLSGLRKPGTHMVSLVLRQDLANSDYQLIIHYYY